MRDSCTDVRQDGPAVRHGRRPTSASFGNRCLLTRTITRSTGSRRRTLTLRRLAGRGTRSSGLTSRSLLLERLPNNGTPPLRQRRRSRRHNTRHYKQGSTAADIIAVIQRDHTSVPYRNRVRRTIVGRGYTMAGLSVKTSLVVRLISPVLTLKERYNGDRITDTIRSRIRNNASSSRMVRISQRRDTNSQVNRRCARD